jgi:ribosomal protein S27AE
MTTEEMIQMAQKGAAAVPEPVEPKSVVCPYCGRVGRARSISPREMFKIEGTAWNLERLFCGRCGRSVFLPSAYIPTIT